ncbi:MAG: MotA/TolQ/ExbB proton channel family protein [Phycisphaerae bacterium]
MNTLLLGWGTVLAQAEAAGTTQILSVWDFLLKGGIVMIPIGVCSLVALAITIERLVCLQRRRVIPPEFMTGLDTALGRERDNAAAASDYCQRNGTSIANIILAALRRMHEPNDQLERHIQQAGERELERLRKRLRLLGVMASIAPLLGLLGTVFGMITAFQTVAASGAALGKTELLARGIYEALITTAAGLIVAIPTLLAHHAISARIDHLVLEMDEMTVRFVESLRAPSASTNGRLRHADAPVLAPASHGGEPSPALRVADPVAAS